MGAPSTPRKSARTRRRNLGRGVLALLGVLAVFLLYKQYYAGKTSSLPTSKPKRPSGKRKHKPIPRKARAISHSFLELSKLDSTLSQPHTATIAALIVCEDEQTINLRPLLASLEAQTLPPSEAVVLCELEADELLSTPSLPISLATTEHTEAALAIIETARRAHADFLFVLDADSDPLPPEQLDTLVHAAGTVEYSAAILTTKGVFWTESEDYMCLPWAAELDVPKSAAVHLPSAAYLVQRTWLSTSPTIEQGLHLDLHHGHALAMALWLKAGINAFALPLKAYVEPVCDNYKLMDADLAAPFLAQRAVSTGHARTSAEYLEGKAKGQIAFTVYDFDELLALSALACAYAEGASATVSVVMREGEVDEKLLPCFLEIGFGSVVEAATADVIFYASHRAAPVEELKAIHAWTADYRIRSIAISTGPTAIYIPAHVADELSWAGTLDLDALKSWHRPRIDLAVITNNRPESLARLLRSLSSAEYYGDHVSLSISLEQTADLATHRLIESFAWPYGSVNVRHRVILGGLMPAITEAWYPASNDSYGVFLEDDVELSPLFYGWLKFTILKYRYSGNGASEQSRRLYGISLYQQKALELRPEGRRRFDAHALLASMDLSPSTPYLSQVPCSWGAVYFPEVWREFHLYLALRLSEIALGIGEVVVPDIRSNRWPRSWKKYFVELVYARGYTMLYPNYPDWMSFSTNHLEAGTHIRSGVLPDAKRRAQFEVPLAPRSHSLLEGLPLARLPGWPSLPVIDFWGNVVTEEELISRGWSTIRDLALCPLGHEPPSTPSFDARELLCATKGSR